jgi:hypothetical protein
MSLMTKINNIVLREVSAANVQAVRDIVNGPDFNLTMVEEAAMAGRSLCLWVQKADNYLQAFDQCKDTVFKIEALKAAVDENLNRIDFMVREMNTLQAALDEENEKQVEATKVVEEAKKEVAISEEKATKCKRLVQHLTVHFGVWEQSFAKLEDKSLIIGGNSVMAAASLEYLSILDKELRRQLKNQWQKILSMNAVKFSANFRLEKFVGTREELYNWRLAGLPESSLNLENALVMKMTSRPKLVFDPNDTCLEWLTKFGEKTKRTVLITSTKDKDQTRKVQNCLEKGGMLIVDFFDGEIVGFVASLLAKVVRESEGQKTIKIEDMMYNYDDNFDFILLTRDEKVIRMQEMQSKCCIINFALDTQGLQQSLTSLMSSVFHPELEQAHLAALESQLEKRAFMANNQDKILKRLILNSDEILLEDREYMGMLEKFSEASTQILKQAQKAEAAKKDDDEKSNQSFLGVLLVDCYLILERFAEWERLLKLSVKNYLSIVHRCILAAAIKKPDEITKDEVLGIIKNVFNAVAGGVTREIRLFMVVDLCVIILKLFSQFRQELWSYVINSNAKKIQVVKNDDLDLEFGDSLWKKLQNLRAMIPEIEMEHLPILIQTFKTAPTVGIEKAMKDALTKTVELSSLERLAMYVSFVPENFNLCLELFADDVLPGSRWQHISVADGMLLASNTQPLIFLPQGGTDFSALSEEIDEKVMAIPQLVYCSSTPWNKLETLLNKGTREGIPLVLTEFHLNKSLHEPICRYLRQLKDKESVEATFRVAILLPQDCRELPVELSDMAIKVLEQKDEEAGDSLPAVFGRLNPPSFQGTTLKLQNAALNSLLAFMSVRSRSLFGEQGFLSRVSLSDTDLDSIGDFYNELGSMKLPLSPDDLPVVEHISFTMFFGSIDNPVDLATIKWFWHQAFLNEQKSSLALRYSVDH